jgi:hypothetical protein
MKIKRNLIVSEVSTSVDPRTASTLASHPTELRVFVDDDDDEKTFSVFSSHRIRLRSESFSLWGLKAKRRIIISEL